MGQREGRREANACTLADKGGFKSKFSYAILSVGSGPCGICDFQILAVKFCEFPRGLERGEGEWDAE